MENESFLSNEARSGIAGFLSNRARSVVAAASRDMRRTMYITDALLVHRSAAGKLYILRKVSPFIAFFETEEGNYTGHLSLMGDLLSALSGVLYLRSTKLECIRDLWDYTKSQLHGITDLRLINDFWMDDAYEEFSSFRRDMLLQMPNLATISTRLVNNRDEPDYAISFSEYLIPRYLLQFEDDVFERLFTSCIQLRTAQHLFEDGIKITGVMIHYDKDLSDTAIGNAVARAVTIDDDGILHLFRNELPRTGVLVGLELYNDSDPLYQQLIRIACESSRFSTLMALGTWFNLKDLPDTTRSIFVTDAYFYPHHKHRLFPNIIYYTHATGQTVFTLATFPNLVHLVCETLWGHYMIRNGTTRVFPRTVRTFTTYGTNGGPQFRWTPGNEDPQIDFDEVSAIYVGGLALHQNNDAYLGFRCDDYDVDILVNRGRVDCSITEDCNCIVNDGIGFSGNNGHMRAKIIITSKRELDVKSDIIVARGIKPFLPEFTQTAVAGNVVCRDELSSR